jgi:carbon-monoxide dehydrogenase large subunit
MQVKLKLISRLPFGADNGQPRYQVVSTTNACKGVSNAPSPQRSATMVAAASVAASSPGVYPEELLITFLAHRLDRPVRWMEDRREHMMSATHSRDQLHEVEVGFDDEGRILALRDEFIVDCGAWNPIGSVVASNTAVHLPGPYNLENFAAAGRIVVTNKTPNAPYRGAGRPEAVFAMERAIDLVARFLGLEATEARRRNMVRADEMPYRVGLPYRDGEPILYDSGDTRPPSIKHSRR